MKIGSRCFDSTGTRQGFVARSADGVLVGRDKRGEFVAHGKKGAGRPVATLIKQIVKREGVKFYRAARECPECHFHRFVRNPEGVCHSCAKGAIA